MNPTETVQRGLRAKALLGDDMLLAAFESVRSKCAERWVNADTVEERELCHARYIAVAEVQAQLRKIMDAGTLETRRQDAAARRGNTGA